jgi:hypothetical protein
MKLQQQFIAKLECIDSITGLINEFRTIINFPLNSMDRQNMRYLIKFFSILPKIEIDLVLFFVEFEYQMREICLSLENLFRKFKNEALKRISEIFDEFLSIVNGVKKLA